MPFSACFLFGFSGPFCCVSDLVAMRGAANWCLLVAAIALSSGAEKISAVSPRLPRTSAGQLAAAAAAQNKTVHELRNSNNPNRTLHATVGPPPGRGASARVRYVSLFFDLSNFSFGKFQTIAKFIGGI